MKNRNRTGNPNESWAKQQFASHTFGNIISQVGTTPNVYLYAGEQNDPNLGSYYLRARYLNPSTGRFQTSDSFEGFDSDPRTLHKYAYAFSSPVDHRDPSGKLTLEEEVATVTIISVLANVAIIHTAQQRLSDVQGKFNGFSISLRTDFEGSGLDLAGGVDIAVDLDTKNVCAVPVVEFGLLPGSFARTPGAHASAALGAYAGGDACDTTPQSFLSHVGVSATFPLSFFRLFGNAFAPKFPFLGFAQRLANVAEGYNWGISVGFTGLSGASTNSSFSVTPFSSLSTNLTYSFDPHVRPLSDVLPALRAGLSNGVTAAIGTLSGFSNGFNDLANNASSFANALTGLISAGK